MKKASFILFFVFTIGFAGLLADEFNDSASNVKPSPEQMRYWNELAQQFVDFDDSLMDLLMEDCPARLKNLVALDKELFKKHFPQLTLLVGPSGVGKSTLARAIAVEQCIKFVFVKCSLLGNEYKNSGVQNINRIFSSVLASKFPHMIILDELNILTDKLANQNDIDRDMVVALWQMLDKFKDTPHKIIATSNVVDKLPAPLKDRFAHATFHIPLPSNSVRYKIVEHYIDSFYYPYEKGIVPFIVKNTEALSPRMLQSLVNTIIECAVVRCIDLGQVTINMHDAQQALKEIKNSAKLIGHEAQKGYREMLKEYLTPNLPYVFNVLGLAMSAYGMYRQEIYYERQLALQWIRG